MSAFRALSASGQSHHNARRPLSLHLFNQCGDRSLTLDQIGERHRALVPFVGVARTLKAHDHDILVSVVLPVRDAARNETSQHSQTPIPALVCGIAQRTSRRSWSTSQRSGSSGHRVILANTALYSHAARLQLSADCRARSKISHTNSCVLNAVPNRKPREPLPC